MRYNHHDEPRSEAAHALARGRDTRAAVDQATEQVLLEFGSIVEFLGGPALAYSFSEMAKMVARRANVGRTTVYRYLEEACCEDPSALYVTVDNPLGSGHLILFKPDHPRYFPDGKPRTAPNPAYPDGGRGGANA